MKLLCLLASHATVLYTRAGGKFRTTMCSAFVASTALTGHDKRKQSENHQSIISVPQKSAEKCTAAITGLNATWPWRAAHENNTLLDYRYSEGEGRPNSKCIRTIEGYISGSLRELA